MASYAELMDMARAAHAAGDTSAAQRFYDRAKADQSEILNALGAGPQEPIETRGAGSTLSVAPGTTPEQAANIPKGMVYDPRTGGYVDTALTAERMGQGYGAVASFLQGGLGVGEYADEAIGGVDGVLRQRNPEIATETMRQSRQQFGEKHPLMGPSLGMAGGVTSALPATAATGILAALAPATKIGKMAYGGILGALGGGIEGTVAGYGAGNDGDRSETAERMGTIGTILGGSIATGLPLFTGAVGAAVNRASDVLSDKSVKMPGMSPEATARIMAATSADDLASNAGSRIARAGDDAMPVDASAGFQDLLDQSVRLSPSKTAIPVIEARAAQAKTVLMNVFDEVLGGAQGRKAIAATLRTETAPGINQAYSRAYGVAIDYASVEGRAIEKLMLRLPPSTTQKAIAQANDRMKYDGLPSQIKASIGEDGGISYSDMPSTIQLDYIKRAFQQIAQDGKDPLTGKISSEGAFASRVAHDIKSVLVAANPEYGNAIRAASDAFSLSDATELGANLLKGKRITRETVEEWSKTATPIERTAFAQGLRSDIDETMANVMQVVSDGNMDAREARKILRDMSSRAARDKVAFAIGETEADKIFTALERATASLEIKAAVAENSRTAARTIGDANLEATMDNSVSQIGRDVMSVRPLEAGRKITDAMAGNTTLDKTNRKNAVYGEISDFMLGGYKPTPQSLSLLQDALTQRPINAARGQSWGRGAGSTAGILSYLKMTQDQEERTRAGPR
jgi:hypothetical protein